MLQRDILFGIRCEEVEGLTIEAWTSGNPPGEHQLTAYRIKLNKMSEFANLIEKNLNVKLQRRESISWGIYYCFAGNDDYLNLRENMNPEMDNDLLEPEFSDYPFLLYLENSHKYPHYLAAIEARPDIFVKLRTEQY